jgi:RNA polymerase sigma-70 factor (ECF subfamily)
LQPRSLHNEKELLKQVADGDEQAFTVIYHAYSKEVYNAAMAYLKDDFQAKEVVQELFLKVWTYRERMVKIERLADYLFILARNLIFDHFKRVAREWTERKSLDHVQVDAANTADHLILDKQYKEILQTAVASLPPKRKEIYLLARQEGLSYEEIANRLQISRYTVKNQMAMALQHIRTYIAGLSALLIPIMKLIILLTQHGR